MPFQIRKTKSEDIDKILELLKICYDYEPPHPKIYREYFHKIIDEYYALIHKSNMVGNARSIPLEQNIRGVRKKMAGISMVTNAPEVRRKGFIRELMNKMFKDMKEEGIVCSTLYPFKDSFYKKFGFINAPSTKKVILNTSWFSKWKDHPKGYSIKRLKPQEAVKDYKSLYNSAIDDIHGGVYRSEKDGMNYYLI